MRNQFIKVTQMACNRNEQDRPKIHYINKAHIVEFYTQKGSEDTFCIMMLANGSKYEIYETIAELGLDF